MRENCYTLYNITIIYNTAGCNLIYIYMYQVLPGHGGDYITLYSISNYNILKNKRFFLKKILNLNVITFSKFTYNVNGLSNYPIDKALTIIFLY